MVTFEAEKEKKQMYELDYEGDMSYYQDQLAAKGITKEMLNMDNFAGLTARELQNIVDSTKRKRKDTATEKWH